ncbi:pirin family protein [Cetobacterium somerae]|uniref:pirin family protein n=1 Tax=Cetobacterium somerae TaxID=188913 RepID=UPI0022595DB4|nr:pirin-like bicupin family protein [Cetobacterium somerae]MCX3066007.1 pirin family protein [Cetobacterium somerae]
MIIKKLKSHMGETKYDWLYSVHHFSFGDYYDSNNLGVGPLRVINDDIIAPHTGFEMHPHKNMEILTYILEGAITHKDSIHNEKMKVEKGSVQYMSAGTGVAHSEINEEDIETRLAQVWIIPDKSDYEPKYGQVNFKWEDRINKFLLIASGVKEAPIKINQNVNMYALYLEKGKKIKFSPEKGYGYYIAFFQGKTQVDELIIEKYEAIMGDENIEMTSLEDSHMLIFEIKKK